MDQSRELARSLMAAAHERRAALVTKLQRLVDTQQEMARLIELTRRELSVTVHGGRAQPVVSHTL